MVDTGSQITTIDPVLASDLHLKIEGLTGVSGVATQSRSAFTFVDLVEVGRHSVSQFLAIIQDIAELKAADPRIRGILGENFLSHFDLLIDNRQQILCLDESSILAHAIKGDHILLEQPYGPRDDSPFTRPMIVSVRLTTANVAPVLLRLDSGSNAAVLYAVEPRLLRVPVNRAPVLKRVVNGVEQIFAVLPAQDILVGACPVRQVSFVTPMNEVGSGPNPREDGLLPTGAFERVFISYSKNYAALAPWARSGLDR
ncbi:retropepsin-like aspartic protease [Acidicapsa dinghuensis]|uniref:Retropepsin-like aspartic protease n=1 Tax=Acidicapsa dinghuensis TaxID=2218256 RepID=A0ABW1EEY4_9BACT|nr:retropepsin-like aspartic protease [Acidicapsa dinghuensis]